MTTHPWMSFRRCWNVIYMFESGQKPRSPGAWESLRKEIRDAQREKQILIKWRIVPYLSPIEYDTLFLDVPLGNDEKVQNE